MKNVDYVRGKLEQLAYGSTDEIVRLLKRTNSETIRTFFRRMIDDVPSTMVFKVGETECPKNEASATAIAEWLTNEAPAGLQEPNVPIVNEMCPHCMNVVEMVWDVEESGYEAYCPCCGNRLMLCDACLHTDVDDNGKYIDRCDYTNNGCGADGCEIEDCFRRREAAEAIKEARAARAEMAANKDVDEDEEDEEE